MRVRIILAVFLGGVSILFRAQYVDAATLSVSPPKIFESVLYRDSREQMINFTRDTAEGVLTLAVSNEGMDLIRIPDNQLIIFPEGTTSVDFPVLIDASVAAAGHYNGSLRFTIQGPQTVEKVEVSKIQFSVLVNFSIAVKERPEPETALSVLEFPKLEEAIGIEKVTSTQKYEEDGTHIVFHWTVTNTDANALTGIASDVSLKRGNDLFYQKTIPVSTAVPYRGNLDQTSEYVLPNAYPSGQYVFTVTAGDIEQSVHIWIIKKPLQLGLGSVGMGTVFCGVAFVTHRRIRRQRRVAS